MEQINDFMTLENASARDCSTHMGKHTPMDQYIDGSSIVEPPAPASQVIVNTSGSNTNYLNSPQMITSPVANTPLVRQMVAGPPYALQQSKGFGSLLIEESVLP